MANEQTGGMCYMPGVIPTTNYWADPVVDTGEGEPFVNPYLEAGRNQNMTPVAQPGSLACWSFEGKSTSGGVQTPFDGGTEDVPIDPHMCAESGQEHPLCIVAYMNDNSIASSPIVLDPTTSAKIVWGSNRCRLTLNGNPIANEGELGVEWEGELIDSGTTRVFQFDAVFDDGKKASHSIVVKMVGGIVGVGFAFKRSIPLGKGLTDAWVETLNKRLAASRCPVLISKIEFAVDFNGTITRKGKVSIGTESEVGKNLFDTISNSNSSSDKIGNWEITKNLDEYASATDLGESAATIDLGIKGGIEVAYKGFKSGDVEFPLSGKLELAASVFTWRPDETGRWKSDFTTVSLSLNLMSLSILIPMEGAEFKGTVAIRATGGVIPNWRALLPYLVKRFPGLTAITFDALLVVGVFVGFALLLVGAYLEGARNYELQQLRDIQIPSDTDIMLAGYMDGLEGAENRHRPSDPRQSNLYQNGMELGDEKRQTTIEVECQGNKDIFDCWLREYGEEIKRKAKPQLNQLIRRDLWSARANETKDPEDQFYSWLYIVGNSPASQVDTSWLALWKDLHVPDSVFPWRDSGSW